MHNRSVGEGYQSSVQRLESIGYLFQVLHIVFEKDSELVNRLVHILVLVVKIKVRSIPNGEQTDEIVSNLAQQLLTVPFGGGFSAHNQHCRLGQKLFCEMKGVVGGQLG